MQTLVRVRVFVFAWQGYLVFIPNTGIVGLRTMISRRNGKKSFFRPTNETEFYAWTFCQEGKMRLKAKE